jgi:hypothetical protein
VQSVSSACAASFAPPQGSSGKGRFAHLGHIDGLRFSAVLGQPGERERVVIGSKVIANSRDALRTYLRKVGVGVAVTSGCLNTSDARLAWGGIRPFEAARLLQLVERQLTPGATGVSLESDEAHYFDAQGDGDDDDAAPPERTLVNIGLDIGRMHGEVPGWLLARIRRSPFRVVDNYEIFEISLGVSNARIGGLYATSLPSRGAAGSIQGQMAVEAISQKHDHGDYITPRGHIMINVDAEMAFLDQLVRIIHWNIAEKGLTPPHAKALFQAYAYVMTLDTELPKFDTTHVVLASYIKASEIRINELLNKEQGVRVPNAARRLHAHAPAVWCYVFFAANLLRWTAIKGGSGVPRDAGKLLVREQGELSFRAVYECFLPECISAVTHESADGEKTYGWKEVTNWYDIVCRTSHRTALRSDIINLSWFDHQNLLMGATGAITTTTSYQREKFKSLTIVLQNEIPVGPVTDKIDTYIALKGHMKSKLEEQKLQEPVIKMLNMFFCSTKFGEIQATPKGTLVQFREGMFATGDEYDSFESGFVEISYISLSNGIYGQANARIKLVCTLTETALDQLPFVQKGAGDDGKPTLEYAEDLERALKQHYGANAADARLKGGSIVVILAFENGYLTPDWSKAGRRDHDGLESCFLTVADGSPANSFLRERLTERAESVKVRNYNVDYDEEGAPSTVTRSGSAIDPAPERAHGVTVIGNVVTDAALDILQSMVQTVPAGNISNMYQLYLDSADRNTFSEFLATDPHSVQYLQTLPEAVVAMLKVVLPVTHTDTGLCNVIYRDMPHPPKIILNRDFVELDVDAVLAGANGEAIDLNLLGLRRPEERPRANPYKHLSSLRVETCTATSGLTMRLVVGFIEHLATQGKTGDELIKDLVEVGYHLWWERAVFRSTEDRGLFDLIGNRAMDEDFAKNYLRSFWDSMFTQVVSREGYERRTYSHHNHDAIFVRLVLSTFLTLQTAEVSLSSGLTVRDIIDQERSTTGPSPDHAIVLPSRRNERAIICQPSIVPSSIPGTGRLKIRIAAPHNIQVVMLQPRDKKNVECTFEYHFRHVQPLTPQGQVRNPIQRRRTTVNAITQIRQQRTSKVLYTVSRSSGMEVGSIRTPSIATTSIGDVAPIDEEVFSDILADVDCNAGLGSERCIKINEGGELVNGIDTIVQKMRLFAACHEMMNAKHRGQLYVVNTAMVYVFVGCRWLYKDDPSQDILLETYAYVDSDVRFSSRLARGRGVLHDLRMHGMTRSVAESIDKSRKGQRELLAPEQMDTPPF